MNKIKLFAFLAILAHLILLSQIRFTAWPEMLVYPYLLNKGFHFYNDIFHPYFPLLSYILWGFFKLIGFTPVALHFITLCLIGVIDILFFAISTVLFGSSSALILLGIFIPLQIILEGNGMWFDLALVPLILSSTFLLMRFFKNKRVSYVFISGFLLGIAFLVKQTAWIFLLPPIVLFYTQKKLRPFLLFLVSFAIPLGIIFLLFNPGDVLFWSMYYPFLVMPKMPGYISFPTIRNLIQLSILFAPFLPTLFLIPGKKESLLIFGSAVVSLAFLFPRFAYFHLQPFLVFYILLFGFLIPLVKRNRIFQIAFVGYLMISAIFSFRFIYHEWKLPIRFFEPEVYEKVSILHNTISSNEPVFFYNTPGNYIVAGNFLPIKPWADNFSWYLEYPGIQERIIQSIENDKVKYVVFSPFGNGSQFDLGVYRPEKIDSFIHQNFFETQRLGTDFFLLMRK